MLIAVACCCVLLFVVVVCCMLLFVVVCCLLPCIVCELLLLGCRLLLCLVRCCLLFDFSDCCFWCYVLLVAVDADVVYGLSLFAVGFRLLFVVVASCLLLLDCRSLFVVCWLAVVACRGGFVFDCN